ncbi:MAG: hypothetical protein LBR80_15195, partial [Deltaproteobacteria bacterium]|nr:hypothetical protein [Deltaproteobacteria bacterium]
MKQIFGVARLSMGELKQVRTRVIRAVSVENLRMPVLLVRMPVLLVRMPVLLVRMPVLLVRMPVLLVRMPV